MLRGSKAEMADVETSPSLLARADRLDPLSSTCFSSSAISAVSLALAEGEYMGLRRELCAHSFALQF